LPSSDAPPRPADDIDRSRLLTSDAAAAGDDG
jgi:hypothetical protein